MKTTKLFILLLIFLLFVSACSSQEAKSSEPATPKSSSFKVIDVFEENDSVELHITGASGEYILLFFNLLCPEDEYLPQGYKVHQSLQWTSVVGEFAEDPNLTILNAITGLDIYLLYPKPTSEISECSLEYTR
ncbi:MAG: hypothetical protein JW987_05035 [Anaerolineaceae bacterium]|nr:hypothetical protein [Anaerolineaceae bacterium]